MPVESIDALRGADPAVGASLPPARKEALRRALLATDVAPVAPPAGRRRVPRRVGLLVAVVALAITSGSLAVAGVFSASQTADQVRRDYARAGAKIPLPPGTSLPAATFDDDALYAGRQAGLLTALSQADCAWWKAWRTAHSARDETGADAALRGQAKVLGLMPRARAGQSEDVGGFTDSVFDLEHRMQREAAAGNPTTVDQYLYANCMPGVRPGK